MTLGVGAIAVRRRWISRALTVIAFGLGLGLQGVAVADVVALQELVTADDLPVVDWSPLLENPQSASAQRLRLRDVPLDRQRRVNLELQRFSVVDTDTHFAVGRLDGEDRRVAFDPERIRLYRGTVAGFPDSRAFFALSHSESTGFVQLTPGGQRYRYASRGSAGRRLAARQMAVFPAAGPALAPHDVAECGNDALGAQPSPSGAVGTVLRDSVGINPANLRQIELAVETDHEFFQLFGDVDAAITYLVMLYAEISDIYLRDIGASVRLTYLRVWDDANDLFNVVEPTPLFDFRNYWNDNMAAVHRDVAQLLSGRRDYPFGGQGFLSTLCTANAYSVVGYVVGRFPDPAFPSPLHYDLGVAAHELGHNSGAGHTHDAPHFLDTCQNPATTPQRGSIMSYCGQTWSGQNSNRDLYFHTAIRGDIGQHVAAATCLAQDCNLNGIDDAVELADAIALDEDGNGVPDECDDCNGNAILDSIEIGEGSAADANANGVPDVCEPDCNDDGTPDALNILAGAGDVQGNGIPDECEVDCNANSMSDLAEIQADMSLDLNRDAILDACQDCDDDTVLDATALAGAHELWVASGIDPEPLRRFHGFSGTLTRMSDPSAAAQVHSGQDLVATDDGRIFVSSAVDSRVLAFDTAGNYLGDLVSAGAGGLDTPAGMLLTSAGQLLVANRGDSSVLAYDAQSGAALGPRVGPGAGGLNAPFGLALGPDGDLYVTSEPGSVLRYELDTGEFVVAFVKATSNGGLDQPRGMTFKADGNLLVASFGTDQVLEYESLSGAPLGVFAKVGTATRLTQISPWGVRVGPNGNVFVSKTGEDYGSGAEPHDHDHDHDHGDHEGDHGDDHSDGDAGAGLRLSTAVLHLTNAQIYEFDGATGNFLRTHIGGNDHGLLFPTGFDFVPGWSGDCNANGTLDVCDIDSGASVDDDGNRVPDACEVDCNANGRQDRLDVIPFGAELDCNGNLVPDSCDILEASLDCDGNGVPDECEAVARVTQRQSLRSAVGGVANVEGLRADRGPVTPSIRWQWDPTSEATGYDLITGDLASLRDFGSLADATCLIANRLAPFTLEASELSTAVSGAYYLVRARSGCLAGTYGATTSGTRDANACP